MTCFVIVQLKYFTGKPIFYIEFILIVHKIDHTLREGYIIVIVLTQLHFNENVEEGCVIKDECLRLCMYWPSVTSVITYFRW